MTGVIVFGLLLQTETSGHDFPLQQNKVDRVRSSQPDEHGRSFTDCGLVCERFSTPWLDGFIRCAKVSSGLRHSNAAKIGTRSTLCIFHLLNWRLAKIKASTFS